MLLQDFRLNCKGYIFLLCLSLEFHQKKILPVIIGLFSGIYAANATPITSPSSLAGGIIVDFESFALGTTGPIVTSGMTISVTPATAGVFSSLTSLGYALQQYPGIMTGNVFGVASEVTYSIVFDNPVSTFGMGVLDPNFPGFGSNARNRLTAYDANGTVLEFTESGTPDFPTGPQGGNFSTYVGFTYPTAEIKRIELMGAPGEWTGIDNVGYIPSNPVPGPLPVLGVAATFGFSRKLRQRIKTCNNTHLNP